MGSGDIKLYPGFGVKDIETRLDSGIASHQGDEIDAGQEQEEVVVTAPAQKQNFSPESQKYAEYYNVDPDMIRKDIGNKNVYIITFPNLCTIQK